MIVGYVLILLSFLQLLTGVYFFSRYSRSLTTIAYGIFALCSALYVGANGVGFTRLLDNPNTPDMLAWSGGLLTTVAFFFFSFMFPFPRKHWKDILPLVIWPIALFLPMFLFSNLIIVYQPNVQFGDPYRIASGPLFWQFFMFLIVYWSWSIGNLFAEYQRADQYRRWMLRVLLTGVIAWVLLAVFFDVILPMTGASTLSFMGSLLSAVWVISTARILFKK